jgi:protein involved in polysaccharide export with SLBB domain
VAQALTAGILGVRGSEDMAGSMGMTWRAAARTVSGTALLFVAGIVAISAGAQTTTAQATPANAPAGAQPPPPAPAGGPTTRPVAAQPSSNNSAANEVLYPGDVVRLKIWREPDLSGDYQVDDRGMAVFPKIGPVHVSELTTDSLKRMLVATYTTYLRDPAIDVTMLRRVTVLGAVKNPGLYPVDPTMTIADVLALAGGAAPTGNQDKLELIRAGKRQPVRFTTRTPVSETPIRSGDEIYLPERSWISRNGYIVGAMIGAVVIVSTTLIARH